LQITASIIRAICTFDTKIAGFFKGAFSVSVFVEMNKKNCKNFDFCSQVSAVLIENLWIFLPILTYRDHLPPRLALLTFQVSISGFN